MDYDHRATLVGIESNELLNKDNSLEMMWIRALAPVMKEYVAACGLQVPHYSYLFQYQEVPPLHAKYQPQKNPYQ